MPKKALDLWFTLLAAAFLVYAAGYIYRLSFVEGGVRYFTLADDQMISMRYAEHLASGHGLVWNSAGPRVEGYTNFLWVLYMALFHAAGIPKPWISAWIQASGAILLALNLGVVRRLGERLSGSAAAGLVAAAMTAFYVPLDNWAFQGTEVSVLALLVSLVACVMSNPAVAPTASVWMLIGVATLVRPDAIVIAVAIGAAVVALQPAAWMRSLITGMVIVGGFLAVETVLRLWYFGQPLPNTYYLKLTGIAASMRVSRGGVVTVLFLAQLAPFVALILWRARAIEWVRRAAYLVAMVLTQLAYNIYIGGDAWEWWGGSNRFVAIVMPLFFVMLADATVARFSTATRGGVMRLAAATIVCIATADVLAFSVWPVGSPVKRLLLLEKPPQTAQDRNAVRAGLMLRDITAPDAVVAVSWAGAIPYFAERPAIDLLGKMDPRIAHQPMHVPSGDAAWAAFVPGHLKWDYAYSIGTLKPDVVQAPLWTVAGVTDNGAPSLDANYSVQRLVGDWYVRRDSTKVHPPTGE